MATAEQKLTTGAMVGRVPPQDLDAEISVLGAILLDKDAMWKVADILGPEDFYKKAHQFIFQAFLDLFSKGEPIDVLSASSRLKETGKLENVGGTSYLTSLVNAVPTASHALHYARIVQKKKVLRELIDASYAIGELGWQEADDVEKILDEAEKKIFAISERSLRQEFMGIKTALEDAFQRLDTLHKGDGALRGVPTGFKALDNILAGLQKSDLIVLAARPSLGKTALALDIARNVAKTGTPVGIFSLEMSKEQVVDRLIAS
jgi:replicative DNA helicase